MPAAVVLAVSAIGAATSSAFLIMYAVEVATALMLVGGLAYSDSQRKKAKQKAKEAYNAAQVDRLVNITSAVAPRELVLGRVRKGGAMMYKASTGAHQQDLYLVIALAGHEIDAVEQIWLNDVAVTLDANGYVLDAPFASTRTVTGFATTGDGYTVTLPDNYVPGSVMAMVPGFASQYGDIPVGVEIFNNALISSIKHTRVNYQYKVQESAVQITTHLGQAGQTADPQLMAAFGSAWPAPNVAQGVAYIVARLRYSETAFPSGAPNITVTMRGAKVYDPRTGQTVWTENPALMARYIYQHPKFGKATVTAEEDARIIAAANACDTSTTYTVGGVAQPTRPLYRASLVLPFGAEAKSGLDDLTQAMGGSWAFAGGELYIKAGVYTAPVLSLGDADLAVIQRDGASETHKPISISVHKERAQKFNTVKATIWDQAQDYKQTTLSPLVGAALLARDGVELVQEVTMPAVGHAPQALHVAGILMRDARDPLVVDLPFKLRAYPLELLDNVSLTLSRYGWASKTFQILSRTWNMDGSLQLTLKETSAAITQMDAGFLAQGFAANTNLPKPWEVTEVGALTITSGTDELRLQADGTVQSRMRVSWVQVDDFAVQQAGQIEVQYRPAASDGAWSSLVTSGDETQVVTADVQDGQIYIIRARAKTKTAVSNWNLQVQHQVIGKTAPPVDVVGLSYAQTDLSINFSFAASGEADYARTEFRVGASWLVGSVIPSPWVLPASGVYSIWAKHYDTSGNESLTAAVMSVTVTGPGAPDVTYSLSGPDEVLTWTIPASGFTVDRYEIRYGANWAAGAFVDSTKATSLRRKVTYSGPRIYWVAAVDVAGNYGSADSVSVNISAPGAVTGARTEVIDNNALIYWGAPATGSLPVDRYEARKGASWAAGAVIGSNGNSTFTTVFEQVGGVVQYWLSAVDSAGNVGPAVSVLANINQPPDYVLRSNIDSTFSGVKVSALPYDGGLLLPVNTTETWAQHFSANGYATPQAQITAGNPLYIEPGLTTATYTEYIDYGSALPATTITATLSSTVVAGSVAVACQIRYKLNSGDAWINATAGASALAVNFRYVQVVYTFTAAGGANLLQVNAINVKLSIKQRNDSGAGVSGSSLTTLNGVSAYWVSVDFGYTFLSADCPMVQANSAVALIPIVVYVGGVSPTGFKLAFVNTSGGNVPNIPFSWSVKGY